MSPPPNPFNSNSTSGVRPDEETRMRHALGLRDDARGESMPQRHDQPRRGRHFVRDGEVPVVVLNGSRDHGDSSAPINRVEAAEAARRAEQAARERAERALHDAQDTIQHLRTQLAHAELAHGEAIAAERAKTQRAETALQEAATMRESLELRIAELTVAQTRRAAVHDEPSEPKPTKRVATRQYRQVAKSAPAREPQPVKWWLAPVKAKTRGR
jgi:hypothetical protein